NQFDNSTAIIYVVDISVFDCQVKRTPRQSHVAVESASSSSIDNDDEIKKYNALKVQLREFKELCSDPDFISSLGVLIVILNKIDLFRYKIEGGAQLNRTFTKYKGKDVESALQYIRSQFRNVLQDKDVRGGGYFHITCAADLRNIARVWAATTDILY